MLVLPMTDDLAIGVVHSIRSGSIDELSRWLADHAGLATCVLCSENGSRRTLLHVVADWPGYFPMGPTSVRILVGAGADPDQVGTTGEPSETALHWAASSDDVEVAEALIDCGADINAPGASIAGEPPLDNAVGYAVGAWRDFWSIEARASTAFRTRAHSASEPDSTTLMATPSATRSEAWV